MSAELQMCLQNDVNMRKKIQKMYSVLLNGKDYFLFNIMENIHWHKALTIHSCVRCYIYSYCPRIGIQPQKGDYAQIYKRTKQIQLKRNFKEKESNFKFPLI